MHKKIIPGNIIYIIHSPVHYNDLKSRLCPHGKKNTHREKSTTITIKLSSLKQLTIDNYVTIEL